MYMVIFIKLPKYENNNQQSKAWKALIKVQYD